MNVSETGSTAGATCAGGIGLEFVRPMGVPPYAAQPDDTSDANEATGDDSTGGSASQPNIYGGQLDLKA
jgi:hypothetical protein